jgi:hypothetical protein
MPRHNVAIEQAGYFSLTDSIEAEVVVLRGSVLWNLSFWHSRDHSSPLPHQRHLNLARRFNATGIKFSVGAREALERLGFDAAFPFLDLSTAQSIESGVKAKALQRLPPILLSKLNASGVETPGMVWLISICIREANFTVRKRKGNYRF